MSDLYTFPPDLCDENGHFDYDKFHALMKKINADIQPTGLVDFNSSGYGPSAMIRLWILVDHIYSQNRILSAELEKLRGSAQA